MTSQSPHIGFVRGEVIEINRCNGSVLFDQTRGMGNPVRICMGDLRLIEGWGARMCKWVAERHGLLYTDQFDEGIK